MIRGYCTDINKNVYLKNRLKILCNKDIWFYKFRTNNIGSHMDDYKDIFGDLRA